VKRASLLFLALALIYVAPGFLPGRTFAPLDIPLDFGAWKADSTQRVRVANSLLSDVVVQFIPWDTEIRRMIAEGEYPWVNRYAGEGGPLYANPQTALYSPFTWPRLLFGLDGWAIMALLKLLAAALCAYWLARELDVAPPHAIVSALIYATSAYMIVWLLYPITNVFAVLPGLAAAMFRLMKEPRGRNAAAVILFAALCTAGGHPETLFIGVVGILIFLFWEAEKRPDLGIGALVPSLVGAFLGFALLFVQLVPFFTLMRESHASLVRPQLPHPFRLWAIVSQVLPGALGSPLRGELDLSAVVRAEDFSHRVGGFIGAIALLAIAIAWRALTPALRRGLLIGVVALVISFCLPGVWLVLRHVPLVRLVAPEYGVVLFVLFGAMAAGPALAVLAIRQRKKIGAALIAVGLLALIGGLLPALAPARPMLTRIARSGIEDLRARGHLHQPARVYEERLAYYLDAAGTTTVKRVAIPGALWMLAGFALLAPFTRRDLVVSGAAVAELIAFGAGFNPAVRMTSFPDEPAVLDLIDRNHLVAANFEIFPANIGTMYGVRDAVSYDVLNSAAYVEKLQRAGYDPQAHSFHPLLSAENTRAMAAIGIRYVISHAPVPGAERIGNTIVHRLPNAVEAAPPPNYSPRGLYAGMVISLIALVAGAVWLRLYALPPPVADVTPSPT
jgi:hypothetical protein